MIVDSHQHFWRLDRGDYGWLTADLGSIYRDFEPNDLWPHLVASGVFRTVLVQAAPTVAETEYLLELAARNDFIAGVVGWVDLEAADAPDVVARLAAVPGLLGIRPMVQDMADENWLKCARIESGIAALIDHELRFDALVKPQHLPALRTFLGRYPELPVVIDHGAKPNIEAGKFQGWADQIAWIAADTNAYCKLSGLLTEAGPGAPAEDLWPYLTHLLDCFGASRLMWGSDWPVLELVSDYGAWFSMAQALVNKIAPAARDQVFGETATEFYGLT